MHLPEQMKHELADQKSPIHKNTEVSASLVQLKMFDRKDGQTDRKTVFIKKLMYHLTLLCHYMFLSVSERHR